MSSQKECGVKCFPSALAICILLSPRVPPHPKAEITTNHLAACQTTRRGFYTRFILFVFTLLTSFTLNCHPLCECVLVDACVSVCVCVCVCVSQLISNKLVMMVKVLGCNEASCVALGYSVMPLGRGFAKRPSARLTAA